MKALRLIVFFISYFLFFSFFSSASIITTLYNTGVNGDGAVLDHGELDLHYTITSGPIIGTPLVRTEVGGYPFYDWEDIGDDSEWITPDFNVDINDMLNHPSGTYVYQTTFNLNNFDYTSATIAGRIASDDSSRIILNGVDTGITSLFGFLSFTDFTIDSDFIPGINSLEIHITNSAMQTGNPSGLRLEVTGTADETPSVPEPATLILFASSFFCMFGFKEFNRIKLLK